jgi:hypothetical protein
MRVISVDTENFYSEDVTLKLDGTWGYARNPAAECYMISASDGAETWAGHPREFNFDSLEGAFLLFHNAFHDLNILQAGEEQGLWKMPRIAGWQCTANLSAYLCNRRSLDQAAQHLLGVPPLDKAMRSQMKGRTWDDAVKLGWGERLVEYARADAVHPWAIWDRYSHLWPETERRLSEHAVMACNRGVQVDDTALAAAEAAVMLELALIKQRLPWIADGSAPTSTHALYRWCNKHGIPCPPTKTTDEEGYLAWEEAYKGKFPWVSAISEHRSCSKVLSTLQTLSRRIRPDGTFSYGLKYFGAHTGRWSGDDGFNMQNMPRGTICGADLRSIFVPRPGKAFVICDLSQIEPRVLAWLAGDQPFLEAVAEGMSPYEAHARATMGWAGAKKLKEGDPLMYRLAKARVLGLGYGCGAEKFASVARAMADLDVSQFDFAEDPSKPDEVVAGSYSRRVVKDYRESNPKVTALWRRLDDDLKGSVGGDFELGLPSGRTMRYTGVRAEKRLKADPETGKPVARTVYTADVGGVRKIFYGPLLVENLVQATARDVFAEAILRIEDAGMPVLWHVHDEVIVEVDADRAAEARSEVERLMCVVPEWIQGLPVAAEAQISACYTK